MGTIDESLVIPIMDFLYVMYKMYNIIIYCYLTQVCSTWILETSHFQVGIDYILDKCVEIFFNFSLNFNEKIIST